MDSRGLSGEMASSETPPPSLQQGVRIVPLDSAVAVEEVLLAVGKQVGNNQLCFASRMNKTVVMFLKDEPRVHQLIGSGVFIRDTFLQVSPLSVNLHTDHLVLNGEFGMQRSKIEACALINFLSGCAKLAIWLTRRNWAQSLGSVEPVSVL
ncbi:hypothetical protein L3Q82_024687, partial [Scortum barcoo]